MNRHQQSVPVVIPPALDTLEAEFEARNKILAGYDKSGANEFDELVNLNAESDEIIFDETDAAPGEAADEREAKQSRRAKRRKSFAFLIVFGALFGLLVVFLAWIFGFGFFAPASKISVDRNQKTSGANLSPSTASGDEKLKTALSLVADENGTRKDAPVISDTSVNPSALPEQDLKLNPGDKTGVQSNNLPPPANMIVLPDENQTVKSSGSPNQIRSSQPISPGIINTQPNFLTGEVAPVNSILQPKRNNNGSANVSDKTDGTPARSVFFGGSIDKNNSARQNSPNNSSVISARFDSQSIEKSNVPTFGTLLPVRFLGAVFTLQRGAGGLIRMELSRAVKKGAFSYPAGTVVVGRLRGSEYNRAFVSVIGAIDPKTEKLVKFEGDVLGVDGASGALGTRKSIKSWGARFLAGLREAGGDAVNVLAARGGGRGGTIVLGGTNGLGGEVSSIVRGESRENSFVMVRAGTEAYVLITDLPAEQRGGDDVEKLARSDDQLTGLNLSGQDLAEILITDDPDKIRAALLKMSPQYRALAIKAMEDGK